MSKIGKNEGHDKRLKDEKTLIVEKFMSHDLSNNVCKEIFSKFGAIEDISRDFNRGYLLIAFEDRASAEKAVRDKVYHLGVPMLVRLAVPVLNDARSLIHKSLVNENNNRSRSPNNHYRNRSRSPSRERSSRSPVRRNREQNRNHSREQSNMSVNNGNSKINCQRPYELAVIALSSELIPYAEEVRDQIEQLVGIPGNSVVMRAPTTHIFVLKEIEHVVSCLEDLTIKGVLYAVIVNEINKNHSSCTVRTLQSSQQQELRNMPLVDALMFIRENYDKFMLNHPESIPKTSNSIPLNPPLPIASAPPVQNDFHSNMYPTQQQPFAHPLPPAPLMPLMPMAHMPLDERVVAPSPHLISLFNLICESRFLSIGELDQLLEFIEARRIKLGAAKRLIEPIEQESGELKNRILDMLYPVNKPENTALNNKEKMQVKVNDALESLNNAMLPPQKPSPLYTMNMPPQHVNEPPSQKQHHDWNMPFKNQELDHYQDEYLADDAYAMEESFDHVVKQDYNNFNQKNNNGSLNDGPVGGRMLSMYESAPRDQYNMPGSAPMNQHSQQKSFQNNNNNNNNRMNYNYNSASQGQGAAPSYEKDRDIRCESPSMNKQFHQQQGMQYPASRQNIQPPPNSAQGPYHQVPHHPNASNQPAESGQPRKPSLPPPLMGGYYGQGPGQQPASQQKTPPQSRYPRPPSHAMYPPQHQPPLPPHRIQQHHQY